MQLDGAVLTQTRTTTTEDAPASADLYLRYGLVAPTNQLVGYEMKFAEIPSESKND